MLEVTIPLAQGYNFFDQLPYLVYGFGVGHIGGEAWKCISIKGFSKAVGLGIAVGLAFAFGLLWPAAATWVVLDWVYTKLSPRRSKS